jgi:hypothetical protein
LRTSGFVVCSVVILHVRKYIAIPKLSPQSITLLDGAIVPTRRDGSAKWQARFKVTTGTKDLEEAKEAAR